MDQGWWSMAVNLRPFLWTGTGFARESGALSLWFGNGSL